jgi:hypothetical protein
MNNQSQKPTKLSPLLGVFTRVQTPHVLVAVLIKSVVYNTKTQQPEMIMGDSFRIIMN